MDTQTSSRDRMWGSRALLLCVQGHHPYQASPKAQDIFLQGELTVDISWRWEKQGRRWACGPPESCSPLRVRCCFSPTYQPYPVLAGLGLGSTAWHLSETPPFPPLPACLPSGQGEGEGV